MMSTGVSQVCLTFLESLESAEVYERPFSADGAKTDNYFRDKAPS